MCLWAFRYAIGRSTYAGSDTVAWLKAMWGYIQESDKRLIRKEADLDRWLRGGGMVPRDIQLLWEEFYDWSRPQADLTGGVGLGN